MESKAGMISYLRFVYGSDKGNTHEGDMFNNSLFHGTSDMDYSSAVVNGEVIADNQTALMYVPVIPGSVEINRDGTTLTEANGDFTVDAASGEVSGLKAGDVVTYRYNNEDIQYNGAKRPQGVRVPQINLELAQLPIFAQSRKLAAYWGFDAAYDLKKQ